MSETATEQIRIREATAEDLPTLLNLYSQLGMDDGEILPRQRAETIFLRISNYPDYRIYLAETDNEPVGTFALLVMDNLGHMGNPSAIIEDVVVSDSCRGQGIGQKMMAFATDLAQEKGCYKFYFSSNINRIDAHRFYENLGFKKHGYCFYLNL